MMIAGVAALSLTGCSSVEEKIERAFYQHRHAVAVLVEDLRSANGLVVTASACQMPAGADYPEADKLCKSLQARLALLPFEAISVHDDGRVHFEYSSTHFHATAGSMEGLAYSPKVPERVVDSLSSAIKQAKGRIKGCIYRAITDGWYVYYCRV
jgi:hypothetical protein